ncbi:MAG: hypothetical protein JWP62_680, partial [Blastococcus sp.]|nr:hypothetical protein [Blastococcus sp.]
MVSRRVPMGAGLVCRRAARRPGASACDLGTLTAAA